MSPERREPPRPDGELDAILGELAPCAVSPTRRLIEIYVRGQLSDLPRKSVMPMARDAGVPPRTLQELLSLHRWDEERMRELLQRRAARLLASRTMRGAVLDVSYPKKGRMTPGVARQVRPETGRSENCVRVFHLVAMDATEACLLDSEIYLPESWTGDPGRLKRAGIAEETPHRNPADLSRRMVERVRRNGFAPPAIAADEIREIPPTRPGFVRSGERARPAAHAADPDLSREEIIRRGATWNVASTPFTLQGESRGGTLLALREPRAGRSRYFLLEGEGYGAETLLHRVLEREDARAAFERLRHRLGFGHFEVRSYRSLRRHFILSSVGSLFLREASRAPEVPVRGIAL